MQVPTESGGVFNFTPSSLEHLNPKPVIRLRWGERRHKEMVRTRFIEEGVISYTNEQWRKCLLEGYLENWGQEAFDGGEPLIKELWDAEAQHSGDDFVAPNPDLTVEGYNQLVAEITACHAPLRKINAAMDFADRSLPMITISLIVMGWSGIELPFKREAGLISVDTTKDLCEALVALEAKEYGSDPAFSPVGLSELWLACSERLYLTAEAEKNSPSPVPSPATQSDLEIGQVSPSGQSKASDDSPKTPETESIPATSD